jgi:hypothetical protein
MASPAAAKRGKAGKAPRATGKAPAGKDKSTKAKETAKAKEPTPKEKPKGKPGPKRKVKAFSDIDVAKIAEKLAAEKPAALSLIRNDHPEITSEQYALAYAIPADDIFRMQRFAMLYLTQQSTKQAALLMGYDESQAGKAGALFLDHPFTQLYIAETLKTAQVGTIVTVGQLAAKAWEEANKGDRVLGKAVVTNSTTRLKAMALLGQWLRLGAAPEREQKGAADGGGVMIVPGGLSPDEWENHARQEQASLKKAVAVDAEIISSHDRRP